MKYETKTASQRLDENGKIGVPIGFNNLRVNVVVCRLSWLLKLFDGAYLGFGVMQVIPVREIGFDKDRKRLS